MKKLLVSLMALSIVTIGAAANAGTLSNALNNAATKVNTAESSVNTAKSAVQAKQEQAQQEAAAKKEAREKAVQEKKDAWNTLIGK